MILDIMILVIGVLSIYFILRGIEKHSPHVIVMACFVLIASFNYTIANLSKKYFHNEAIKFGVAEYVNIQGKELFVWKTNNCSEVHSPVKE